MAKTQFSLEDMKAVALGKDMAIRDVLTVLIRTHPDIGKVAEMICVEREASISTLLGSGYPDKSVEAYREMIDMIRPHKNGDEMSPS